MFRGKFSTSALGQRTQNITRLDKIINNVTPEPRQGIIMT